MAKTRSDRISEQLVRNSEYWTTRFTAIEQMNHQNAKKVVDQMLSVFTKADKQIQKEIAAWYVRFAENNEISLADAKKLLSRDGLEELKWDIAEYIKYGRENAIDQRWMKELESASSKFHISRLDALQLRVRQAAEVAFGKEQQVLTKALNETYANDYYHTAYEIQKGFGVGFDIGTIDQAKLEKLLKKPWTADGLTFSDRVWRSKSQLIDSISKELTQMCILGKAPDETIKNISKRLNVSKSQAGRLVMTESAYFASAAQKECFSDLGVEEYEIVATLDSRTSELCQDMDGQVFKMSEFKAGVTAPPFHVWCRSTTVPYFNDEFTLDETRAARGGDGQTYQVPSNIKYNDWFRGIKEQKGQLYQIPDTISYAEWEDSIIEKHGEGLRPLNLQYFAESPHVTFGCNDTTQQWIRTATPNSHKVEDAKSVVLDGIEYIVDGDNVYLDYDKSEKHIADVLEKILGGKIQMNPKFRKKYQGIQCGDYTFRGDIWDLKTLGEKSGKDLFYNAVHKKKKQAHRFIIDISNNPMTAEAAVIEAERLFRRRGTIFVEEVIIIKDDSIVKILTRK